MKPVVALLLSIVAIPAAFGAGNAAQDFFARLAGDWQGAGEGRGMASAQKMSWEPVLDGKAWRFSALAFYRIQDDGTIAGT